MALDLVKLRQLPLSTLLLNSFLCNFTRLAKNICRHIVFLKFDIKPNCSEYSRVAMIQSKYEVLAFSVILLKHIVALGPFLT